MLHGDLIEHPTDTKCIATKREQQASSKPTELNEQANYELLKEEDNSNINSSYDVIQYLNLDDEIIMINVKSQIHVNLNIENEYTFEEIEYLVYHYENENKSL